MTPAISVVIPAHNEEKYIQSTLLSLKQQTFQQFETIVVTNGCTDKTEEIVSEQITANASGSWQLLKMLTANVSRARNHGASKARGEILVFLDADTLLQNDVLQKISLGFNELYSAGTTMVKPDSPGLAFRLHSLAKNVINQNLLYQGWISGVLICRKKDFDDVNGYDHQREVREHRELILKLLQRGRYALIDAYAITSMRRFHNWGWGKTGIFWLKQFLTEHFGDITKSKYEKVR